jgi:hypothetical protein
VRRLAHAVLAISVAGCNPYSNDLPPARCEEPGRDCLPGEVCAAGTCRADGRVSLRVALGSAESEPLHAVVLGVPPGEPATLRASHLRLLAIAEPIARETLTLERVPRVRSLVLAWAGAPGGPCVGDPVAAEPLALASDREVTLLLSERWSGGCWSSPPSLAHQDRFVFGTPSASSDAR